MKEVLLLVALGAASLSLAGCQKAKEPAPVDDAMEGPVVGGAQSSLFPEVNPVATPTPEGSGEAGSDASGPANGMSRDDIPDNGERKP